jgi:fibronectin-binding autotransporter adhesin
MQGNAGSPSTWIGVDDSNIIQFGNWDNGVPYGGIAVFNGDGDNAPISGVDGTLMFSEIEFTAATQLSVITQLQISDSPGVSVASGISANFAIYEQQYPIYDPARFTIESGPAGDGGGTVTYNLEGYGQLYAISGSSGETVVNVIMTSGNNYFQIDSAGSNLFDNISSDATSDEIVLFSDAELIIRGSDVNVIDGVISGEGSLTMAGTGILTLNGDNTYDGTTTVAAGTLVLNGSVSGDCSVALGSLLKGIGNIGGTLTSSGTIAPGNSIGTLVTTNFFPTNSSVFECEIESAGLSDAIVAIDTAILAGALHIIPLDLAFTAPQTYVIISAGIPPLGYGFPPFESPLMGSFSLVTSPVPALMSLNYASDALYLTYLPLSAIDVKGNALAAIDCFVTVSSSDSNAVSGKLLALTIPEIENAFNQMQPSQFSAMTWTQMENALLVRSGYLKHLEGLSCDKGPNTWVDLMGEWQHQGSKGDQFGYNDWTGGVSLGSDTRYNNFRWGGSASYTYSTVDWKKKAGNGHINSYYGGLFGGWSDHKRYVNISTLGAYSQYQTSRHIHFTGLDRRAHAHHNGWEALTGIEAGIYSELKHFKMGPFARVDYIYLSQQEYDESDAKSLNLHVDSRQDQLIQSEAGVVFTRRIPCGTDRMQASWTPRLELSYINQTPLGKSHYHAQFTGSSCGFEVSGWSFNRNLGAVDASLAYLSASEKLGVSLRYDGQFGSRYWNQSAHIVFDIKY